MGRNDPMGNRSNRSGCSTGTAAVHATGTPMAFALDQAISMSLSPQLAARYKTAIAARDPAVLFKGWYSVMEPLDNDPCTATMPRSDWDNVFDGYDALKRGILSRFKARARELGA